MTRSKRKQSGTPRQAARILSPRARRKAAALLAGIIALAAGVFFSGIFGKFFGHVPAGPGKNPPVSAENYRVEDILDGDTIALRASSGEKIRVRLYGVDAPELHQSGGREAAKFATLLLRSETVSLRIMDTDPYGRTVGLILLQDGRSGNAELVKAGHAWVYRAHCHEEPMCASWYAYEHLAKREGRGLWRSGKAIPPWRWRRQNPRR